MVKKEKGKAPLLEAYLDNSLVLWESSWANKLQWGYQTCKKEVLNNRSQTTTQPIYHNYYRWARIISEIGLKRA